MTMPKQFNLRIMGTNWKVFQKSNRDKSLSGSWGCTYFGAREIIIDESLQEDAKLETLIHELCHVVCSNIQHLEKKEDKDLEERLCNKVGPALYELIRSNPHLGDIFKEEA